MIRRKNISKYKRPVSKYKSVSVPSQLVDKGIRPIKFVAVVAKYPAYNSSAASTGGSHTLVKLLADSTYWNQIKNIYQYFVIGSGSIEITPIGHKSGSNFITIPNMQMCYDPLGAVTDMGSTDFPGKWSYSKLVSLDENKAWFAFRVTNLRPVNNAMSTDATLDDTVTTFGSIRIRIPQVQADLNTLSACTLIYRLNVYLWGSNV